MTRTDGGEDPAPLPDSPSNAAGEVERRRGASLQIVLAVTVALVLVGLVWALGLRGQSAGGADAASGTDRGPMAGQPVSEFAAGERGEPVQLSGRTLTGKFLDLRDLRGRVVVLNVWGSWCAPCREEAPVLARLSREYADQGVSFVGINVKDNRAAALAFEERYGITYPSIEDPAGEAVLAMSQHVPVSAVPVTLVLDREGRVASRVLGAVREATLRALLDAAVAEST